MSAGTGARRLADESGFTLFVVMSVMLVISLFTIATFATVDGDTFGSARDVGRKQAYAAAEAGIADYLFHLNEDSAYWTKCDNPQQRDAAGNVIPNAVNQVYPGTGKLPNPSADPTFKWRTVPGSTARYAIELVPVRRAVPCTPGANVAATMMDEASRSLRIRATGRVQTAKGEVDRTIIASLKRTSFLDYLYFTDYENMDAAWYTMAAKGGDTSSATKGDLRSWAASVCNRKYVRAPDNRDDHSWSGTYIDPADGRSRSLRVDCADYDLQFAPWDRVLGPAHTNDELWVCNSPVFGRSLRDRIESLNGYRKACGVGAEPKIDGTWVPRAAMLTLPPTDAALEAVALPAYKFTGRTNIELLSSPPDPGKPIRVTNAGLNGGAATDLAYPSNGVIYVKNGACVPYDPLDPYAPGTATCGNAWVKGTYTKDLTIGTQNDIVVNGNVIRADGDDSRLGLIADGFIRVWHDVIRDSRDPTICSNYPPGDSRRVGDRRIDAAILSLQHSFMVDNYYCGTPLGTLTVNGAIGQKYRGPVGRLTSGAGAATNGYIKEYNYDDRLAFRGPPHFLDPVQASWKVRSYTEQLKAR
jgi:hypothetical protein